MSMPHDATHFAGIDKENPWRKYELYCWRAWVDGKWWAVVGSEDCEYIPIEGAKSNCSEIMAGALRDCISVMENELKGLYVIQPELKQARMAIGLYEIAKPADLESDQLRAEIIRLRDLLYQETERLEFVLTQFPGKYNQETIEKLDKAIARKKEGKV